MFARFTGVFSVALYLAVAAAGPAGAQPVTTPPRIIIQGCAMPAQPPGCLAITYNGQQYNVSNARPPIPTGMVLPLSGTVSSEPSLCPGINLADINYTPTNTFCM